MSFEFPDHDKILQQLDSILTEGSFERIVNAGAFKTLEEIRAVLRSHVRTGQTLESVDTRKITDTPTQLSYEIGSNTRGQILYWLDKGRGAIRPKNKKALRWLTFPDQIVVFARYARATRALNFMESSATSGLQAASEEATRVFTE